MAVTFDFSSPENYNKAYIPSFNWTERYLHYYGGGGSGKSEFVGQKLIIESFEKKHGFLVIRKIADTHRDSTYALLCDWINTWNLQHHFHVTKSPLRIINNITKAFFTFRGVDDPEKIKSIKGATRTWIEEASELDREDFNQIDLRLRGYKSLQHNLTYNPIDSDHWLKTDWHDNPPPSTKILKTTYLDNRFVGDDYQDVMARLKEQDSNYYNIYALGQWGGRIEGIIFSNFEIINTFPEAVDYVYGLDFGYGHPTGLVKATMQDGDGTEDIICDELLYEAGLTTDMLIKRMDDLHIDKEIPIYADGARPETIEAIKRAGYYITTAEKSVLEGIMFMKGIEFDENNKPKHVLKRRILITANSANLQKELKRYAWKKDRNGKQLDEPIKAWDDAVDALRYAIYSHYSNAKKDLSYMDKFTFQVLY